MSQDMQVEIEPHVDVELNLRRFRWRLNASGEPGIVSPQTFATKREATIDGELARERAQQRGRRKV